ncbi:MAG TPA: efflux RND transporter periplasmic adaptor subunit [Kofleriaceae bacterium]|nr:efflux RND transporter periplasmic adaptor subunit [Kofleriaceae bacterium]
MSMTRTFLTLLAAAGLSLAPGCKRGSSGDEEMPPAKGAGAKPRPALPDTRAPEQAAATAAPTADRTTGTTEAIERAEVAPSMSAIIDEIVVDEGDRVKKGQLLFRLRGTDMSLRVEQARSAQKSAEVNLAAARVEYERMQRLLEKNAIERAQFDRVKAQYDAAQAGVNQAKVGVSMARQGLGDASVESPISGIVVDVAKNEGEMATMMPPTVVVVVEDQSKLELRFRMPEASLANLREGAPVVVTFEAIGETREAKISWVAPTVDPRTRTVEYVAVLDNPDGKLKSGMLAVVTLAGGKAAAR